MQHRSLRKLVIAYDFLSLQNYMDLSKGHIRALQEGDLSSPKGIEACINASEALLQCMNVALRPGMCEKHCWVLQRRSLGT